MAPVARRHPFVAAVCVFAGAALLGAAPVPACTDFYTSVNATWVHTHPVPADMPLIDEYAIANRRYTAELGRMLAKAKGPAADYYESCMNVAAIERAGNAPLAAELKRIDGIHDRSSLAIEVARLHDRDVPAFFLFGPGFGAQPGSPIVAELDPEPLTVREDFTLANLGHRDRTPLVNFVTYIRRLFIQSGVPARRASDETQATAALRLRLSSAAIRNDPKGDLRLPALRRLSVIVPAFDWAAYARARGLEEREAVELSGQAYLRTLENVMRNTGLAELRSYLRYEMLTTQSTYLSAAFRHIEGVPFTGTIEEPPEKRAQTCIDDTTEALPRESTMTWRESHDVDAIERHAMAVVGAVRDAFKQRHLAKVAIAFESQPAALPLALPVLDRDDYAGNAETVARRYVQLGLAAIGRPPGRAGLLEIDPTEVDAAFIPSLNAVVIPLAILQSPIFADGGDPASNFGALGALAGHEFSHATSDVPGYGERMACIAEQITQYRDDDGAPLPGKQLADEDVADLTGLTMAYRALPMHDAPSERRFFTAFARMHAVNMSAAYRVSALDDEHAPDRVRVNATLANMPEFARAFGCPPRSPMARAPRRRCSAW
jgi:putative endopeptidase